MFKCDVIHMPGAIPPEEWRLKNECERRQSNDAFAIEELGKLVKEKEAMIRRLEAGKLDGFHAKVALVGVNFVMTKRIGWNLFSATASRGQVLSDRQMRAGIMPHHGPLDYGPPCTWAQVQVLLEMLRDGVMAGFSRHQGGVLT